MNSCTRHLLYTPYASRMASHRQISKQHGQALVEGLVVLMLLLSFWVGIAWLGRIQDMALQAQHAGRFAAFSATRNATGHPIDEIRGHFFSGAAHQWSDRQGKAVLRADRSEVTLHLDQTARLEADSQPGSSGLGAARLRTEWRVEDRGILRSAVRVAPRSEPNADTVPGSAVSGLAYFDHAYPTISRHVSILVDAAHADDDAAVQRRVSESRMAWGDTAEQSRALGRRVDAAMDAIDAGWGRSQPQWDWLSPWAGYIPGRHVGPSGGQHAD